MEAETTIIALSVFLLLNYLDFLSTRAGLLLGAKEQNPLARLILDKYGYIGLFTFKFLITAVLPFIYYIKGGDIESTLWIWNALLGLVVAWNSGQILRKRRN